MLDNRAVSDWSLSRTVETVMVVFITYNPVVICKTSVGEAILEMCTETGIKLTVLQMKVLFN